MEKLIEAIGKFETLAIVVLVSLIALDSYVWISITETSLPSKDLARPQSQKFEKGVLVIFPDGVKILIDAGSGMAAIDTLEQASRESNRYVDIAIISERNPSSFGGFIDLLQRYDFGAVVYNGRDDGSFVKDWSALIAEIDSRHIPLITIGAGDRILIGEKNAVANEVRILTPDRDFVRSPNPKEAKITEFIEKL